MNYEVDGGWIISARNMTCLLKGLISIVLLSVVVVTPGRAATYTTDCTPKGQNPILLKCSLYPTTGDCDKPDSMSSSGPPLPSVVDIRQNKYVSTAHVSSHGIFTGTVVTWKSPDPTTLNATSGYTIRGFYYEDGVRKQQFCRYMKIWSVTRAVLSFTVAHRFELGLSALSSFDKDYTIEIDTLPHTPGSTPGSIPFRTYKNVWDKIELNMTFDLETPYSLKASFRRSSFGNDSKLYNHTMYDVYLVDPGGQIVSDMYNEQYIECNVSASKTEEYAEVSWENLLSGNYAVKVWPKKLQANCVGDCLNIVDDRHTDTKPVIVPGYDYKPQHPPTIEFSNTNAATATFLMAPSNLRIEQYEVVGGLSQGNGITKNVLHRRVLAVETDEWQDASVRFTAEELYEANLAVGDKIQVAVKPKFRVICGQAGFCHLQGNCTPCTASLSKMVLIPPLPSNPGSDTEIVVVAVPIVTGVIIVILAVYIGHKMYTKRHNTNPPPDTSTPEAPLQTDTDTNLHAQPLLTDNDGSVICSIVGRPFYFGTKPCKLCIVYSAGPHNKLYGQLAATLTEIFAKYHSWEVVSLSEVSRRDPSEFNSLDFLIFLCSEQLHSAFKYLHSETASTRKGSSQMPTSMTCEMVEHEKVLSLLRSQQERARFARIMVTFDHLPNYCSDALVASPGNPAVTSFTLPNQFEQLLKNLYLLQEGAANISTWDDYLKDPTLNRQLDENIKQMAEAYKQSHSPQNSDLGYYTDNTRDEECLTITTEIQQLDDDLRGIAGLETAPNIVRLTPETAGPARREHQMWCDESPPTRYKDHNRRNTEITINPKAEEMKYIRHESANSGSVDPPIEMCELRGHLNGRGAEQDPPKRDLLQIPGSLGNSDSYSCSTYHGSQATETRETLERGDNLYRGDNLNRGDHPNRGDNQESGNNIEREYHLKKENNFERGDDLARGDNQGNAKRLDNCNLANRDNIYSDGLASRDNIHSDGLESRDNILSDGLASRDNIYSDGLASRDNIYKSDGCTREEYHC